MMRALLLAAALVAAAVPAARAADLPADFSGVWMRPSQRGPNADPRGVNPAIPKPPLKAPYDAQYAAFRAKKQAAEAAGEPLTNDKTECLPDGMPYILATSLPFEIANTANGLLQVFEFNTQVRHIFWDTDKHPGDDDLVFSFFGDSIAHWEGKALVVDTIGVRPRTLMFEDAPHGEKLRIAERYELVDGGLLRLTITMTDPDYLSAPWTVVRNFARQSGMKLQENLCLENQRSVIDSTGRVGLIIKDK